MGEAEDTLSILVYESDPFKEMKIGKQLGSELRETLAVFLKNYLDIFAWDHLYMIGIDL